MKNTPWPDGCVYSPAVILQQTAVPWLPQIRILSVQQVEGRRDSFLCQTGKAMARTWFIIAFTVLHTFATSYIYFDGHYWTIFSIQPFYHYQKCKKMGVCITSILGKVQTFKSIKFKILCNFSFRKTNLLYSLSEFVKRFISENLMLVKP